MAQRLTDDCVSQWVKETMDIALKDHVSDAP